MGVITSSNTTVEEEAPPKKRRKPRARKSLGEALAATGQQAIEGAVTATAQASAAAVAEGAVLLARHHAGVHWPAVLDTPAGRAIAQASLPLLALLATECLGDAVPMADLVEKTAKLAYDGTAKQAAAEVKARCAPYFRDLLKLAMGTPVKQLIAEDTTEGATP